MTGSTSPFSSNEKVRRILVYAIVTAIAWSSLIALSYRTQKRTLVEGVERLAISVVRSAYEKDIRYRHGLSRKGGVYISPSSKIPQKPNQPGSQSPSRNTGYTIPLAFEGTRDYIGPQGHITSLQPLSPANKADEWETMALRSFERGVPEVTQVSLLNGKPHMRMIRPFVVEKACLRCHGQQGYKIGDIRGGISVSIPLDDLFATQEAELRHMGLWHAGFWLIGLLTIGFGSHRLSRDTRSLINQENQLQENNEELEMTEEELRQQLDEYLQTQNELLEEKEKLDTVMACMGDGLAIVGTDFKIIFQNKAMSEMFGTGGDIPCYAVYQNRSEPCPKCPVAASFQDGGIHTRQIPMKVAGREIWFETTASPFHDAMGRVVGGVQIYRNVNDRRRHQEEIEELNSSLEQRVQERTADLEQTNRALETANREMESFSYSVSHDLRAPLRHINGYSQALNEEYGQLLDANGKEYLKRICAASDRMALLIDDLLELSRVTRTELHRKSINLSGICRAIAANLRESDPKRETTFVIEDGANALGDPLLMRQALENILGNAWKYTSKTAGARIEFGISPSHSTTTYFVKDNGVGFDMAYSGKLFGAFQRLHGAEFEGTGIGLATVQRIIQRHGGTIWAEGSEESEGHGATFYFTL